MKEVVYFNGAIMPRSEARVPVMDYGFLFGYGLFETMRAYDGVVFRIDSHLARLKKSAETLNIPIDLKALKDAVYRTIDANKLKNARIRLTLSAGEGGLTPDPGSCAAPNILVLAAEYVPHPQDVYEHGIRVIISSIRRNSQSPVPRMKSANALENLLSRQEARSQNADDSLLLNDKGFLAEASSSNVFLVAKGTLKTPGLNSGILPGISRALVLEMAARLGIGAVEADVRPDELTNAEEFFLTNSMIEILPVTGVAGSQIGSGTPGHVTRRLITNCKEIVARETGAGRNA